MKLDISRHQMVMLLGAVVQRDDGRSVGETKEDSGHWERINNALSAAINRDRREEQLLDWQTLALDDMKESDMREMLWEAEAERLSTLTDDEIKEEWEDVEKQQDRV